MRTSVLVLAVPLLVACSSGQAPSTAGSTDAASAAASIARWKIEAGAKSTTVRGYDDANAVVATFQYRATRDDGTTFNATLDIELPKTEHATMKIEADAENVTMVTNTFEGSPAARAIVAQLIADLGSTTKRGSGLTTQSLAPLDNAPLVSTTPVALTQACSTPLVVADAARTISDCLANVFSTQCHDDVFGVPQTGTGSCCTSATTIAEQFEGRDTSDLENSGELPLDPGVDSSESCANFVSAVLNKSGLIDWHTNLVADEQSRLLAAGWTQVDPADAKAGDVAILNDGSGQHTELVDSNDNGALTLIGSNNVNADGSQKITKQAPYSPGFVYYRPPGC